MSPYRLILHKGPRYHTENAKRAREWLAEYPGTDAVAVLRDVAARGFLKASDAVELEREAGKL